MKTLFNIGRRLLWRKVDLFYHLIRPFIFRQSAQDAHYRALDTLARLDNSALFLRLAPLVRRYLAPSQPIYIGGVSLPSPFIVAAGLVKGAGFSDQTSALSAVSAGENIIMGWRSLPALLGAVEFGSFTPQPRLGNAGTVVWRDPATRSTQNRIGLRNAGACASAEFLARQRADLPPIFGINLAPTPALDDDAQAQAELVQALDEFLSRGIRPAWFTLNLSCPNTEDDPACHQTSARAQAFCSALVARLQPYSIPLWVKLSPDLSPEQYHALMQVFAEVGVRAVIATNTLAQPTPDDSATLAGVGGGRLHTSALSAAYYLTRADVASVDVIACGGILDADSVLRFRALGIQAYQLWSALVYRSPLAPFIIESELP